MNRITEALRRWWLQWVRGIGLLVIVCLAVIVALIIVGLPMVLVSELTGDAAWQSWWNIAPIAAIVSLPFCLIRVLPGAIDQLFTEQRADEQMRKQRKR